MGFGASTYGLIFCHDFLKLFQKMKKLIIVTEIYIFFQLVHRNKSYAQISSKQGMGQLKKISKFDFFFEFFSIEYINVYI